MTSPTLLCVPTGQTVTRLGEIQLNDLPSAIHVNKYDELVGAIGCFSENILFRVEYNVQLKDGYIF